MQLLSYFTSGCRYPSLLFVIACYHVVALIDADQGSISLVQKRAKLVQAQSSPRGNTKNVLFIVVDDLRTNIGAYNFSHAQTPHLDRLAKEGLTFKRSYVQFPFCAPSRNSFMTGRRPDATRSFNFLNHFREEGIGEEWSSLPEYFKNHGYLSLGVGKIFHDGLPLDNDNPRSWSPDRPYPAQGELEGHLEHGCAIAAPNEDTTIVCAVNVSSDEPDESRQLPDMKIRTRCIEHLRFAKTTGKNFFVGCGFLKPHVPFEMPLSFFEQIPADVPLASCQNATVGMPDIAWHSPIDVDFLGACPDFGMHCPDELARTYRRAYYAAVAYTDYNIGKVLDELEILGFEENTVVIVFGDHGWHLGENSLWSKYSNFELDLRIPTIIRAPWHEASKGMVTSVLMEAVDFYPTIAELAGLPDPAAAGEMHMGGTSLASVFNDPTNISVKTAAFSQHAKRGVEGTQVLPIGERSEIGVMGYSVRVDDWRYTAWFPFDGERPLTYTTIGVELYSHKDDDGDIDFDGENMNVIDDNHVEAASLHVLLLEHIEANIVLPSPPTPSPTPVPDTGCRTCTIVEDPHVVVFDGVQISLLSSLGSKGARVDRDVEVAGDVWVVRNMNVSVQGRYLPDDNLDLTHVFMRSLAVGGDFLRGNTLLIGPLNEQITWNGLEILSQNESSIEVEGLMSARRHVDSHRVENPSARNPGVDVTLPLGIKLTVNRQPHHVNVAITMPPLEGGQDGLCGNFNGQPSDDTFELLMQRDLRVAPAQSLFPLAPSHNVGA